MRKLFLVVILLTPFTLLCAQSKTLVVTKQQLKDKIMGGWAGQTIGVTFGGPYEFRYQGTFIGNYQKLDWHEGLLKDNMINNAGLYDDLYMDLTFVDVFERYGLDATVDSFANAYANAGYMLWHANQAGRYNILHGIKSPQSGYWKNNPHADCIDYQIESDFAGLMSPGMPNTASVISDKIGHIMNYGDGWYGGVYIGAMYTLAFTSNDISYIVNEALKTIPQQSEFYQCINDVIEWHKKYPGNWKDAWFMVQQKWANDIGCPEGVFLPFNIDAKVNAAYVVIGLLYGAGDFTRSLEIATRCGQDADCNPSSVGGILGTVLGYDKIPAFWKQGLKEAEDINFKYTTMSLNKTYDIGIKHALENIERNGGIVNGDNITLKLQQPVAVKFEKSFDGIYPVSTGKVRTSDDNKTINFSFEGTGFVLRGETAEWGNNSGFVIQSELYIDDKPAGKIELPTSYTARRYEVAWNYDLPKGKHSIQLKLLNATADSIKNMSTLYYSDKPVDGMKANETDAALMNK